MLSVLPVLGQLLAIFGATYALPLITSLVFRDGTFDEFGIAALATSGVGTLIWLLTRQHGRELKSRDGFLLVTLAWVSMSGAATIPLMLLLPELTFTDAFFEAVSGLTTTGSTVLTGLDALPPSINLWRHALHWLGGMGIIVLA
ncbi:MAG TPA: potassium transporter TrkG, partial [Steroidobacteraceae bacterium]|nr:potassium transporter TrkG [Steroidobacteraceae bacterium]